jgi:hypothetical protein
MSKQIGVFAEILVLVCMATLWTVSGVAAADIEQVCIKGKQATYAGETIACYSDAGCHYAESMGDEPIRDYDVSSAPYALARGKIAAIVTSSPGLAKKVPELGGTCARAHGR